MKHLAEVKDLLSLGMSSLMNYLPGYLFALMTWGASAFLITLAATGKLQ